MLKSIPVNTVELGTSVETTSPAAEARRSAEAGRVGEVGAPSPDFGATLASAIQGVDQLQLAADHEAEKAAMGAGNLHELSLSLEKADVAMRVATKVRNKVVEAYHEIMRMSV
jgi:flagellar hook-basal body complex protein FliE